MGLTMRTLIGAVAATLTALFIATGDSRHYLIETVDKATQAPEYVTEKTEKAFKPTKNPTKKENMKDSSDISSDEGSLDEVSNEDYLDENVDENLDEGSEEYSEEGSDEILEEGFSDEDEMETDSTELEEELKFENLPRVIFTTESTTTSTTTSGSSSSSI